MKIYIASGNRHKIKEITEILGKSVTELHLDLHSIQEMNIPEPDEPYQDFMQNAIHKAKYYADFTKAPTLSEDAGLCIDSLDNFPGVKTKDFVEECGSLVNAFATLEKMLNGKNNYAAYFVCAAALYIPAEKRCITFEGRDAGTVSFPARGDKCFGFDPIFVPHGYSQTMAELGHEVKNVVGHRAIAIRGIAEQLYDRTYKRSN